MLKRHMKLTNFYDMIIISSLNLVQFIENDIFY